MSALRSNRAVCFRRRAIRSPENARLSQTKTGHDRSTTPRAVEIDLRPPRLSEDCTRDIQGTFGAPDRSVWFALENVGAATWKDSIGSLKGGGRLVTCGSTSRPVGETLIPLVFWKQLHIIGSTMANRHELNDVVRPFFAGRLKAILAEMVALKDEAAAPGRPAGGKQFGKIVLRP